jgi:hypothetical protein
MTFAFVSFWIGSIISNDKRGYYRFSKLSENALGEHYKSPSHQPITDPYLLNRTP